MNLPCFTGGWTTVPQPESADFQPAKGAGCLWQLKQRIPDQQAVQARGQLLPTELCPCLAHMRCCDMLSLSALLICQCSQGRRFFSLLNSYADSSSKYILVNVCIRFRIMWILQVLSSATEEAWEQTWGASHIQWDRLAAPAPCHAPWGDTGPYTVLPRAPMIGRKALVWILLQVQGLLIFSQFINQLCLLNWNPKYSIALGHGREEKQQPFPVLSWEHGSGTDMLTNLVWGTR